MATYKQLSAQLEKLHKEVAIAQQKEIAAVIEDIKRKIVDYDLTVEELGFSARRGRPGRRRCRRSIAIQRPAKHGADADAHPAGRA